jgi:hypothetical protein
MDEETLKTPIPKCHFCLGWCSNFIGSETGQKQSVKQNMVYNTTQHPPLTVTHCLFILYVYVGKGGGVREKVEGQKYTRIVPSSMGTTVHKQGRKYQP